MASAHNYIFENMSRLGNDNCSLSQDNVQNLKQGNYLLTNFYSNDCTMQKPISLATNQPNVFFTGGHQTGAGGCNIDANSDLFLSLPTKPACKISLMQRPFATVPFLGRGTVNTVLESQMQQGDIVSDKKSVATVTEDTLVNVKTYPMIPSLHATVSNPANLVEGAAAEGWIRGGLPSRELVRDTDYTNQQSF
jgi:hypothetical protein